MMVAEIASRILFFIAFLIGGLCIWYELWGNKRKRQYVKIRRFDELEEWIEKYQKAKEENAIEINSLRKKYITLLCSIFILLVLALVFFWIGVCYWGENARIIIAYVDGAILSLCFILYVINGGSVHDEIKKIWLGSFISKVDPNAMYISGGLFRSELYRKVFNWTVVGKTTWEDTIRGEEYEISDVKATFGGSGSRNKYSETVFKGSFAIIDVKRTFSPSYICNQKINLFDKKTLVSVDNEQFNHLFEIHAREDKELASTYLTDFLLNYLVDFRKQYDINFDIVFDDKIYVRFYTGDMFRPSIWSNKVDKQSIYKFYCITKFIKDIKEIMK